MELPKRKKNRLENYDYSQKGSYFITLCTEKRQRLFEIESDRVGNGLRAVPPQNKIIHKWIKETEHKYNNIHFDKYVIMPDHLHFIITITERHIGRSLRDIMHFFKTMTTNEYIKYSKDSQLPPFKNKLWQKSYYDHVIRNQDDYNEKYEYIENNPIKRLITNKTQDG